MCFTSELSSEPIEKCNVVFVSVVLNREAQNN